MDTTTVQAVYQKGMLKPKVRLNLPEGALVQVQVTSATAEGTPADSLFGAFPELATLTENDFEWAKRLWEHGLEKQSRILDGLE